MPGHTNESGLSIVGTWSLIEAWDIGADPADPQKKTHPWGDPPAGYWVYDRSGHFSLMISRNPPLPIPADPFAGNRPGWLSPSPPWEVPHELLIETFSTARPYAYFGEYTVEFDRDDPTRGVILHAVFSDVMRAYTGTTQRRKFRFDGPDHLDVGEPGAYLRRLRRLTG